MHQLQQGKAATTHRALVESYQHLFVMRLLMGCDPTDMIYFRFSTMVSFSCHGKLHKNKVSPVSTRHPTSFKHTVINVRPLLSYIKIWTNTVKRYGTEHDGPNWTVSEYFLSFLPSFFLQVMVQLL